MRPPSPVVELVVSSGKVVSRGDSEDVVKAGRLVSAGASEDVVVVSLAVEASSDVSALSDVLDGAAVEAADEDRPSADVSDEADDLGACASTVVKGNMANRNRKVMDAMFSFGDGRIAGKMKENV